jgi:antitoxin MazE
MQAQIQKWGNSLGVRIPKDLANKLHIENGVIVDLEISDQQLIITRTISELELLLNNITETNSHHEILTNDDIIGNELW